MESEMKLPLDFDVRQDLSHVVVEKTRDFPNFPAYWTAYLVDAFSNRYELSFNWDEEVIQFRCDLEVLEHWVNNNCEHFELNELFICESLHELQRQMMLHDGIYGRATA